MNPNPAFFIVCGDLVDAMPNEWPQIRESQEKDFFRVFSKLTPDIPLVCVCGNHDVGKLLTRCGNCGILLTPTFFARIP